MQPIHAPPQQIAYIPATRRADDCSAILPFHCDHSTNPYSVHSDRRTVSAQSLIRRRVGKARNISALVAAQQLLLHWTGSGPVAPLCLWTYVSVRLYAPYASIWNAAWLHCNVNVYRRAHSFATSSQSTPHRGSIKNFQWPGYQANAVVL